MKTLKTLLRAQPVFVIAFTALLLRLAAILYVSNLHRPDLEEFGVIAKHIVSGRGFSYNVCQGVLLPSAYMPPAYPLILAGFLKLLGDQHSTHVAVELVQAFLGSLLCVIIYKISLTRFSFRISLISALMLAIWPVFVYAPTQFSAFSWYCLVGCLLFLFLIRLCHTPNVKHMLLVGVSMGILTLFRSETIMYVPVIGLWLFFNVSAGRRIAAVLLPLIISLLIISPWTARNYVLFRRFVPMTTSKGYAFWRGNNPQASGGARSGAISKELAKTIEAIPPTRDYEVLVDDAFLQEAVHFVTTHPAEAFSLALKKFLLFWTFDPTYGSAEAEMTGRLQGGSSHPLYLIPWLLMLPFFLAGLIITRRTPRDLSLFYVYFGVSSAIAMIFFVLPRYRLYVEPLTLPFVATSLDALVKAVVTRLRSKVRPGQPPPAVRSAQTRRAEPA